MSTVQIRTSLWEAIAGRAPARPAGPADPGLWAAVVDRLNPAKARPRLRDGVERVTLTTARGADYVMLRSPEHREASYLRLSPEEAQLATRMDGERTAARLVADFAAISGRLAPDQVTRVVADLAGNRMLDELPLDAFRQLDKVHRRPPAARIGRGLLAAARGQRAVLGNIDRLAGLAYRSGGKLLFTRPAAVLLALVATVGLGVFVVTWTQGTQSVFLTGDSYLLGALTLFGLNVLALSCHEMGHALAAKHAGRRAGAAGFMMYFGIPTVFVDTTDVWMAGRRARLLTTFAGPAAALTMAGTFQLVALVFPAFAPLAFKLSFAWYLNSLFNLNPLMALDGYYLAMDYLEIPNLRARGMAFLAGKLRRRGRSPRWSQLDREGRLVALYGILSVLWLVVMANLLYRLYQDRVSGLIVGLWESGPAARLLLVAVVAGVLSPLVYLLLAWLGRVAGRARARLAERNRAADQPRRLDALRATALGTLPPERLTELAARAQWVRPRRGSEVAVAGAALPGVYAVVDGALEARHPGDPTGTVRSRVAAGGLVGVASALTGAPSALTWRAAGTRLLRIPPGAVAGAVGPLSGPPPAERAELESLLVSTPALRALDDETRLGVLARSKAVDVAPAQLVTMSGAHAAVVAAGVLTLPGGAELRRGALLGPGTDTSAVARTRARIWTLPSAGGLALLLAARPSLARPVSPAEPATTGVHAAGGYPPLAAPPGPPTSADDGSTDGRFERRLRWLLLLLLLFALLLVLLNTRPPVLWAEQPDDHAQLIVDRGTVSVTTNGQLTVLDSGDRAFLGEGAELTAGEDSAARLVYRGGGYATLCAESRLRLGPVRTPGTPSAPTGRLTLAAGTIVADTTGANSAFQPLSLAVTSADRVAVNDGAARFAVRGNGLAWVADGVVKLDDVALPSTTDRLGCAGPITGGIGGTTGDAGSGPATNSAPSTSTTTSRPPETTTTAPPTTTGTTTTTPPTTPTTTSLSQPPGTTTTTTAKPPPDTTPPRIGIPQMSNRVIDMEGGSPPCGPNPTTSRISAPVTDNAGGRLTVWFNYVLHIGSGQSGDGSMPPSGGQFAGTLGPIAYNRVFAGGGRITTTVHARDAAGNEASRAGPTVTLDRCD